MGWREALAAWWNDIRRKRRASGLQIEDVIEKSPEDGRVYRGLVLDNGMKILLISDPTTDKSAAALDVNVGHMSDPEDYPGLAHLCEHMLFMGTTESREANGYNRFLCEHGGSSNAYTSMDHTNYHFDVAADAFQTALTRFSKFIKSPSFSSLVVDREIRVVDAEHQKNKNNDQWRLFQLNKSTADPTHPYSKFGTGNLVSLLSGNKDAISRVYKELVHFHKTFYSANAMCLVVLGKETLEHLEELVVPLFSCVRSNGIQLLPIEIPPYGSNELKVQLKVVPVKDMQNMLLMWPIDDMLPLYRVKPAHYVGHCIGFQGAGSVFAELKKKGWINSFAAAQKFGGKGYMFFCVSMDLTDSGFDNTDAIILMIFQFINLIQTEGLNESIYEECSKIKSLRFRYKDKELPRDYVSDCAELLHAHPFKDILTGAWLMWEYQPSLIKSVLDCLSPDNLRVTIRSKKFTGETNHIEKWYGTEYSIHPIPEVTIKTWREAGKNKLFHLPLKNEFIPESLALEDRDPENPQYPVLLEESQFLKLWYKQDNEFLLPKTYITFLITSHIGPDSPYNAVHYELASSVLRDLVGEGIGTSFSTIPTVHNNVHDEMRGELLVDLLNDQLEELSYPAQIAGSIFDMFCTSRGITITVQGFSDKIEVLLRKVLEKIITFKVDEKRFCHVKNKYLRTLSNFDQEPPFKKSKYLSNSILSTRVWTKAKLLQEAKDVACEQVCAFLESMLSEVFFEILVYGNVTRQQTRDYAQIVKVAFIGKNKCTPLANPESYRPAEIQLLSGHETYYVHKSCPSSLSPNAVLVYWQCGPESTQINIQSELFVHLINQHAYDVMRTQKQLGYIVFCEVRGSRAVRGIRLVVQSRLNPDILLSHIMEFMSNIHTFLENMSQDTFDNHRNALKLLKTEKPKRLMDQSAQYWREISTNKYKFDRQKVEASYLEGISKSDILDFYQSYFVPGSKNYRLLTVHVEGETVKEERPGVNADTFKSKCATSRIQIEDIEHFKEDSNVWC